MQKKVNKVLSFERDSDFFFKLGIKYAEKNNNKKAAIYMNKAVEIEPYNADYQINLAGIMVEIGEIEKSSEILKGILLNIDPTLTECYFGIGCNYFDLEDFSKAREYFEKYILFDPDGAYSEDVYDVLYYLKLYDGSNKSKRRLKSVSKLVNEGEKLLDNGDYLKASKKLETALESDPSSSDIRNNLSVAYFFSGDIERAISIANSVLKLDLNNVDAYCNLVIFYNSAGRMDLYKEHIKVIYTLKIEQKEDLLKVLNTCIRLKEFTSMGKLLRNYIGNRKEFLEALEKTLDGWNISGDKKQEIVNGLSSKRQKIKET